jgi:hypothetical protein
MPTARTAMPTLHYGDRDRDPLEGVTVLGGLVSGRADIKHGRDDPESHHDQETHG